MSDQVTEARKSKSRSPNHPILDLKAAIEKVEKLHGTYGATHAVPLGTFCKAFDYAINSSGAIQLLATLKTYNLVTVTGAGDARKIVASPAADRIIRKAPDRPDLIRQAALAPAVHKEVWEHYEPTGGLPHNDILRQYLMWERPEGTRFTEEAVGPFIERLRATLDFAGIGTGDKLPDDTPRLPKAGDFVQWTSQGVDQFPVARKLLGVSPDGAIGFIEGEKSGAPMDQLTIAEHPGQDAATVALPANPFYKPPASSDDLTEAAGFSLDRKTIDEGPIVIRWPDQLSKDSVDEFEYWVQGLVRRARRKAGIPLADEKKQTAEKVPE